MNVLLLILLILGSLISNTFSSRLRKYQRDSNDDNTFLEEAKGASFSDDEEYEVTTNSATGTCWTFTNKC